MSSLCHRMSVDIPSFAFTCILEKVFPTIKLLIEIFSPLNIISLNLRKNAKKWGKLNSHIQ